MSNRAVVTLATNDDYAIGACVLGASLRAVETNATLVVMVTPGLQLRNTLASVFDKVVEVDLINSGDEQILQLIKRPELSVTITKINCWRLIEYEKAVFLDADTLVMKNIDELFDREELSAVCDLGWPDCFNSGVFVYKPNEETFKNLLELLGKEGSFDGGDQGLLNSYFNDWAAADITKHLSFIYNMTLRSVYTYPPAYRKFGEGVKIVHFLGSLKPWNYYVDTTTGLASAPVSGLNTHHDHHVQAWWDVFICKIKSLLSPNELTGLAHQLATLDLSKIDDFSRRRQWESGIIDYLGVDSFDNIQKKLDESIGKS